MLQVASDEAHQLQRANQVNCRNGKYNDFCDMWRASIKRLRQPKTQTVFKVSDREEKDPARCVQILMNLDKNTGKALKLIKLTSMKLAALCFSK